MSNKTPFEVIKSLENIYIFNQRFCLRLDLYSSYFTLQSSQILEAYWFVITDFGQKTLSFQGLQRNPKWEASPQGKLINSKIHTQTCSQSFLLFIQPLQIPFWFTKLYLPIKPVIRKTVRWNLRMYPLVNDRFSERVRTKAAAREIPLAFKRYTWHWRPNFYDSFS